MKKICPLNDIPSLEWLLVLKFTPDLKWNPAKRCWKKWSDSCAIPENTRLLSYSIFTRIWSDQKWNITAIFDMELLDSDSNQSVTLPWMTLVLYLANFFFFGGREKVYFWIPFFKVAIQLKSFQKAGWELMLDIFSVSNLYQMIWLPFLSPLYSRK